MPLDTPHILGASGPQIDTGYHYVTIGLDTHATPTAVTSTWLNSGWDWGMDSEIPSTMAYMASTLGEDGFSVDSGVDYNTIDVPGRSELLMSYQGGSAATFQLTLQFFQTHAGTTGYTGEGGGGGSGSGGDELQYNIENVVQQCRWLDRLKNNFGSGGIKYPPPPVIVRIGSLFIARCILTSGTPTFGAKGAGFVPGTMLPRASEYQATFTIQRAGAQYSSAFTGVASGIKEYNQFLVHSVY